MTTSEHRRRPGRPRSTQADQAILTATLQELTAVGYESMSIEGIAQRAGVGKSTIYRRWPSKEALVMAATRALQTAAPIIDTGDLRHDLHALIEHALALGSSGPFSQRLIIRAATELVTKPELAQSLVADLLLPRFQHFAHLIERAKARGELRPDLNADLVLGMIAGPIFYYWLLGESATPVVPPSELATQIVSTIFDGMANTRTAPTQE
ncbi:MAG: TetR/AcrR family transcriptional regulator [Ktedonobacterales bacterium]